MVVVKVAGLTGKLDELLQWLGQRTVVVKVAGLTAES